MNIDWSTVGALLRHELRMVLRDRRTIIFSILLPVVILPIMLFSSRIIEEMHQERLGETTYAYVLTGDATELARELIDAGRLVTGDDDPFLLEEVETGNPAAALDKGKLHFYLECETTEQVAAAWAAEKDDDLSEDAEGDLAERTPAPRLTVVFRADRDASSSGARKVGDLLLEVRDDRRQALLRERSFPVEREQLIPVEQVSVAAAEQVSGSKLGRFLTLLVVMLVLTGGSVVATDSIAGEKERGTLETLLTTAAGRIEIVAAKQITIFLVAILIVVIQVVNLLVYIGLDLIPLPEDFLGSITPGVSLLLLLLYLPLAALAASLLLLISGRARTYKEAQLFFFPVYLFSLVPALASLLPAVKLRSAIVVVPVANVAVAVREILSGETDLVMVLVTFLVMVAVAVIAARMTVTTLSTERLISGTVTAASGIQGRADRFADHILRWFGLIWVVVFVVAMNVSELSSLRAQILFNVVLMFTGGTLLLIRRYRLDPKQALAMRLPRAAVWPAVLFGVPAGLIVATGVFKVANIFFPVPVELLQSFGDQLLPEGMALWELMLFVAILPGIGEEIAFRGLLFYGLSRKLRPLALVVSVALIFSLFHFSLFRIAPTAFLGLVLGLVVLLTGSIWPAMLWHALSNGLSVLLGEFGIDPGALTLWQHGVALVVMSLSFLVIWAVRTPYPGLRPWRAPR